MTAREAVGLSRAQPWTALTLSALALHWAWEMLQAPLFANMRHLSGGRATWLCTRASVGDVALTLAAYGVVAAAVGNTAWLLHPRPARIAGYLAVGLILTAALETLSVQRWDRWSYAADMPRVVGVGLAPLAQWVVVPLVVVWVVRRYLARRFSRRAPSETRRDISGDSP